MNYLKGQQFRAGIGVATVLPDFDFETYTEAGLVYDAGEEKWKPLPGLSANQRGMKGVGARNAIQHPSFRILSLSWDLKDGKGKRWWRPVEIEDLFPASRVVLPGVTTHSYPDELLEYISQFRPYQDPTSLNGLIEAWNSGYEWQVWEFHAMPKLNWPRLDLRQMRCAMAKSKLSGNPAALDDAGDVVKAPITKDPRGKALIRKLSMPRNPTTKNPELRWTPRTAPQDFHEFYAYNVTDIASESEVSIRLPDLDPFELRVWQMDQRVNMRGMQLATGHIDNMICIVEQCREREHARLFELTNGRVKKSTEVAETLRWMEERGTKLYNLDEETVELELAKFEARPGFSGEPVYQVLQIRQRLAFGSVNKLYKMRAMATMDGRLVDQYSYAGAHTKLWNGRDVQMANLYSGIFKKPDEARAALEAMATRSLEFVEYKYPGHDALEIVASCLRSMVCAAPGHRLISADFTAIQAVVTSCLALEWWRIKVFQTHGKIYEAMASEMTGKPLQFYFDYKAANKKHHPDRQDYGKLPTLSGDFGAWIAGWKKFGADKVLGSDENIKAAILKNRQKQPNIVELWGGQTRNKFNRGPDGSYAPAREELYGLEGAIIRAIKDQGRPGEVGQAHSYNGVTYQCFDDVLYCRGPSGGTMAYHHPRLHRSRRDWADPWEVEITYEGWNTNASKGRQNAWETMYLYGGVATQNIVAHESRQIQACVLLALDEHASGNYPVVMHTHDENVVEVPIGRGSVAEYMQIVRGAIPKWAVLPNGEPWPIKIPDAWECDFYGKWED